MAIDPAKSIPAFYAEQSIFLTGATGFLGKVFIEKLLRSCSEIREIFLLIRPKKGMSIANRLEKILSLPIFDQLRKERPSSFEKLIPVSGDASEKELGLSIVDRQMLIERVTIVVHASASVRFNETLKYAVFVNTRSTRDICMLAENMKNLKVLVYISSTFTQADKYIVEEKEYTPKADWRQIIEVAESVDDHLLNVFTLKYMDNVPNTYIFTKNLAEGVIQDYSKSLPCAIVRTTMVISALSEPIPGWIDNLYGSIGLLIGAGKGIIYTGYLGKDKTVDWIPVDIVIRSLIQVIWKCGLTKNKPDSACLVFNSASGTWKKTWHEFIEIMINVANEIPYKTGLPTVNATCTTNFIVFYILSMLYHILPAFLIDQILKFSNQKPIFLKLLRNIYVANSVVGYFAINEWIFKNTNIMFLNEEVPSDDAEVFKIQWPNVDMKEYMMNAIRGTKRFLFHEDISQKAINAAKARIRRINLFLKTLKIFVGVSILWAIYQWNIRPYLF